MCVCVCVTSGYSLCDFGGRGCMLRRILLLSSSSCSMSVLLLASVCLYTSNPLPPLCVCEDGIEIGIASCRERV